MSTPVLDPNGVVPLYHQLAQVLRWKIATDEYPVGGILPSEAKLVEQYEVSRVTVRQAVGVLVSEGLVVRSSGRGTRIIDKGAAPAGQNFSGSLSELIFETSRSQVRDISIEQVKAPQHIVDALKLSDPTVTRVSRSRLLDDQIFAYSVDYLPTAVSELIDYKLLEKKSLMTLLAEKGLDMASAQQSIRADIADPVLAAQLNLQAGDPVLAVDRVVFNSASQPLFYVQSRYRGDRYTYTVQLGIQGSDSGPLHADFA